jgi:cell division protein FtsB
MIRIFKSKEVRSKLKQIRKIDSQIIDEIAHIQGHKHQIDVLKQRKDQLFKEIDRLNGI